MLKIFLSSTFRDLSEHRSNILDKLNAVFEGVGMEKFIPDGTSSQEVSIRNLKESDIVIFLISPYYGSLMDDCSLKDECKAECPMKTGNGRISYIHCEYKTAISEEILHQTYLVEEGWDNLDVKREALDFKDEIRKEFRLGIQDVNDISLVELISNNLATKIIEWHTQNKLDFKQFCDREDVLNQLMNNIDGKVEVYGVGGIGKTALIQVALLIQKLKGKKIISIGVPKAYASGSGFEYFRIKCKDEQYIAESQKEITIYDIINALVKIKILFNPEEIIKKQKKKKIELLSTLIRKEENLTIFIDDYHLATKDVVNLVKSLDNIILSSRRNTYVAKKEICITGIDEEDREDLINLYATEELPVKAKELIKQIAEGHPISTELLVKNYQNIDFNKVKNFNLENANDDQVKDFYKRVIVEIFSANKQALVLLKNLAVLNLNLESNIDRETAQKSYNIENSIKVFKELVDTGMLKKREGREGTYEFYFIHIQDVLEDLADDENHNNAIKYYEKKKEIFGEKIDDAVEILYHKVKSNPNDILVDEFLEIKDKTRPVHYGFQRLINVGEDLKVLVKEKNKVYILWTLGTLYYELGRFEGAETAYKEALEIWIDLAEKSSKAYKPVVAKMQNNLGTLYSDLGRFEEAETAYQESLEIWIDLAEKSPEAYRPEVAMTQNNLGILYGKLRRFEEAETLYQEALEIRIDLAEKSPEVYRPDVAMTQNNLGILYRKLGRFEEAETLYQEALEIRIDLADKSPEAYLPKVATTQNNLGTLYYELGRFEEAEPAYQEALEIFEELAEKNPDAYKPDVAMTQNNLGNLHSELGKFEEAEPAYQEALEIFEELADENPDAYKPDVAATQNILGKLYQKLGRFEEAEPAYQEALEIFEELAEKNPDAYKPNVATTQNNLGNLHSELGKFEEAETAYEEALENWIELADKNPDAYKPIVAMTQNILGKLYQKLGRFEEAEPAYQEALEIFKELTDKNPDAYRPDVATTQNNLGILYRKLGRFEEAEPAYQEALEIFKELAEKNPDAYRPDVAMTQNILGNLHSELGKFEEAETAYQEALEIINGLAEKDPDAYKPDVAATQNILGILYQKLGRFEEAEPAYQEALEIFKELAEKNPDAYRPDVAMTQNILGILYRKLARFEEAETAFQEALEIDPRDNTIWYNKACSESLRNFKEKSIESLKRAIELDKKYVKMAKSDEDFDNIRTSKEFKEIIGE